MSSEVVKVVEVEQRLRAPAVIETRKNTMETICMEALIHKGNDLVSLRVCHEADGGLKPRRKGLTFRLSRCQSFRLSLR